MLKAISPIDGRYHSKTIELANYFSEYALIKYRLLVEIAYFKKLVAIPLPQLKSFPKEKFVVLDDMVEKFSLADAERIKAIENTTNHDVKAVEYFLREQFDRLQLSEFKEFIHFGLTSQDINNTAIPLMLKDALTQVFEPLFNQVLSAIADRSKQWKDVPMLARTHGQPASPTRMGKEFAVFVERLVEQHRQLLSIDHRGKFGGATGNFNAHQVSYPEVDWRKFADELLADLGLVRSQFTTQIEHYDNLAAIFHALSRINTILIDFCRDIWTYISMDYFKQKLVKDEVGSSAMPHKVNPIDFENAEGNLGIANALYGHFSEKLPVSRLQRDLTDSTVLRNIGVPLAHSIIAMKSILKGMDKLLLNETKLKQDLELNWMVVAEGIQTILRREGYPNPYEVLKELTRGADNITSLRILQFIDDLDVSDKVKKELKALTPHNYTGIGMD